MVNQPAAVLGLRDFARHIGKKQSYVTLLKQKDRLVLTADGKVRVAESLARIQETSDPSKTAVAARHAAARGEEGAGAAVTPPAPPVPAGGDEPPAEADDLAGNTGYQASRARREYFEAKAKERDYLLSIGQLMRADEVVAAVTGAVSTLRQRLESLPDILSPRLAAAPDESTCRAILADELEHALEDTARQFANIAKTEPAK